jgi:hypothetical protein
MEGPLAPGRNQENCKLAYANLDQLVKGVVGASSVPLSCTLLPPGSEMSVLTIWIFLESHLGRNTEISGNSTSCYLHFDGPLPVIISLYVNWYSLYI